jgi:aspartyl-tRNA(Asn)/glutamyl-tRNA(Gln) amidotransferase subunit B
MSQWEVVIGLETHAQLQTKSKIFSGSSIAFGAEPNVQANAVDIALPGVLPVLNREAVVCAIKFGLAVGASIAPRSVFARKNYFYPDLPKGYQISQFEIPVVQGGGLAIPQGDFLRVGEQEKFVHLTRAHLEEDAGKSLHEDFHGRTGIDLNRAGTPLLEIVTEPDMRSCRSRGLCPRPARAGAMDRHLRRQHAGRQLPLRCQRLGAPARAEGIRHAARDQEPEFLPLHAAGDRFRGAVADQRNHRRPRHPPGHGAVRSRHRRNPFHADQGRRARLPLLPRSRPAAAGDRRQLDRRGEGRTAGTAAGDAGALQADYGLSAYDAAILTSSRGMADYYVAAVAVAGAANGKTVANWIMGELAARLNKNDIAIGASPISATQLAGLIQRIADNTISNNIAKKVFEALWSGEGRSADEIIEKQGLKQITDTGAIEKIIDEVLAANAKSVEEFRAGKEKAFNALVGQAMKATKGKANPQQVNELLKKKLGG